MAKKAQNQEPYIAEGPEILLFDIETSPFTAYQWSLYQKFTSIEMIAEEAFVLSWTAKFLGSDEMYTCMLPDFKQHYKKNMKCDKLLVEPLWDLMDRADIVIAHNSSRFDIPLMKGRFLFHGLPPTNPFKVIDTLTIARREFRLTSNKLDYLARFLGLEGKNHTDFALWPACMNGDMDAWKTMMDYNEQDTLLLEEVYMKLRAWDSRHPNLGLYIDGNTPVCCACGSYDLIKKGFEYTNTQMYQRYKCKSCGHPNRGRYTILPKEKRKTLITNAV